MSHAVPVRRGTGGWEGAAGLNWPKGYSRPWNMEPSTWTGGSCWSLLGDRMGVGQLGLREKMTIFQGKRWLHSDFIYLLVCTLIWQHWQHFLKWWTRTCHLCKEQSCTDFLEIFKLTSRNYRPQENTLCLKSIEHNLVRSRKNVSGVFFCSYDLTSDRLFPSQDIINQRVC